MEGGLGTHITESFSQGSSFNDSIPSQQSDESIALKNVDKSFALRAVTPTTSVSNTSSQERLTSEAINGTMSSKIPRSSMKIHVPLEFPSAGPSTQLPSQLISATKRTADGEVKSANSSLATSPAESHIHMHSRTSSSTSQASKAAELKTRLSYANFKLRNGYEDMNFSEIERLTSQQGSPVSASSRTPTTYDRSPITATRSPRSAGPTPRVNKQFQMSPPQPLPMPRHTPKHLSQGSPPVHIPASYEQFWKSQSGARPRPLQPLKPSLAPPANIQTRNDNDHTNNRAPPPPSLLPHSDPSTPQRRPLRAAALRSPSEQAASEFEAAEVLTFMSSPNNSGYYHGLDGTPNAKPATVTPMRKAHRAQKGVAGSTRNVATRIQGPDLALARKGVRRPMTDQEMDRRLDSMSDSEEEDLKAR